MDGADICFLVRAQGRYNKIMKLLLTVMALAAVAHGAPSTISHSMEIGTNGVSGSIQNVPLVQIIINKIRDVAQAVAPETVNEPVIEAEPVLVVDEAQNPEPVVVVDQAQIPTPVVVVDKPIEVNPVDIVAVNPEPSPVVVDQPAPAPEAVVIAQPDFNPIDIISVNPMPAPVVLPEPSPAEVVPEPSPAVVVPEPSPVVVAPSPAEVAEVAAPEATEAAGGNQIINVVMNFIFGASGALSSVDVPASVIPQFGGAPRM